MLKRELKINLKSIIIWLAILVFFFFIVFAIYPSIMSSENNKAISEMMKAFPEEVLKMFNMDIVGIESIFGWFQTEGYIFLTLLGGLFSAILGSTILIKEESDKTIEFLYSKPISRNNIVTAKILCGVIYILIFTIVITLFNLCGLLISNDLKLDTFLMLSLVPLLLYYMLFFITLFISTFLKKTKTAMSVGIGFTFISYFLQIVGSMSENVSFIKSMSVFEFVSARDIIQNNSVNLIYLVIGIALILFAIVGTYIRYNKKEMV